MLLVSESDLMPCLQVREHCTIINRIVVIVLNKEISDP